jgi:SAM-dependent methyltransferase
MRLSHFRAFAPHCPICAAGGRATAPLAIGSVAKGDDQRVHSGILLCTAPECRAEYPVIDGIPVILAGARALLSERAAEVLLRDDLDPDLESLMGDALGPGSWFDSIRQTLSTYGWDGWADLDPEEREVDDGPQPGAARRGLARLLQLARPQRVNRALDLGCGAGRTCFDLAARFPGALVLGIDLNFGLLRLAQGAVAGRVSYPRRRIGLAFDRRSFAMAAPHAECVDFWACDASALPFPAGVADLTCALNLLDCVPEPPRLLAAMAQATAEGGRMVLGTPYDWNTRATPVETWIGGHSQRGPHGGRGEPLLRALLTPGAHPQSVPGVRILAEDADWPWHTRLHDRATVAYRIHLLAAESIVRDAT